MTLWINDGIIYYIWQLRGVFNSFYKKDRKMYNKSKTYAKIKIIRRVTLSIFTFSLIGGISCFAYTENKYNTITDLIKNNVATMANAKENTVNKEITELENIGVEEEKNIEELKYLSSNGVLKDTENESTQQKNDISEIEDKTDTVSEKDDKNKSDKPKTKNGNNFFDNSLFIGNSLVVGLSRWGNLNNSTFYAVEGLNVNSFFNTDKFVLGGKKTTPEKALSIGEYDKVFLMFGINEISWRSKEAFINRYMDIVEAIRKKQPKAKIYIQSMLYVTQSKSSKDKIFNNKNVISLNKKIEKMAKDSGLKYIDINKVLCDGKRYLPNDASTDGIHLNAKYCNKWKKSLLNYFNLNQ